MTYYTIQCDVMISKRRRAFAVMARDGDIAFWTDTVMQALNYVVELGEREVTLEDNGLTYKLTIGPVDDLDVAGVQAIGKAIE